MTISMSKLLEVFDHNGGIVNFQNVITQFCQENQIPDGATLSCSYDGIRFAWEREETDAERQFRELQEQRMRLQTEVYERRELARLLLKFAEVEDLGD